MAGRAQTRCLRVMQLSQRPGRCHLGLAVLSTALTQGQHDLRSYVWGPGQLYLVLGKDKEGPNIA